MTTHKNGSLTEKTCLVSGSSRGIGYETALGLAGLGAHVIMVSQNQERNQAAYDRITAEYGQECARYYVADLTNQAEIRRLAGEIHRDYAALDVLINNVGGWYRKFTPSADGIEMTFALNHLSYWLLTGLLLPLLQKSPSARIINVSSDAHFQAKAIQFDDVQFKQHYSPFKVYAHSKLANVLFTYELSRRLADTDLTVNVLHPGFVHSELYRHFGIMTPLVNLLAKTFGKSSVEGAQTSIYLASTQEVSGITGQYFSECQPKKSSLSSYDESQAKQLWTLSEAMTDFKYDL